MINLYQQTNSEIYENSVDQLFFNVECIEFFRSLKIKYKYTDLEHTAQAIIDNLKKEQKVLLFAHEDKYDEKVSISLIKESISKVGMKNKYALNLIREIEQSDYIPSVRELNFFDDVRSSRYKRLSLKQHDWLLGIYGEVFG